MDQFDKDNKFFSTLFFPAFKTPKTDSYHTIHKRFWNNLYTNHPMLALLLMVPLVYLLYRVVKRIVLCVAPGMFYGTYWLDVLWNIFQCPEMRGCRETRTPLRECGF